MTVTVIQEVAATDNHNQERRNIQYEKAKPNSTKTPGQGDIVGDSAYPQHPRKRRRRTENGKGAGRKY